MSDQQGQGSTVYKLLIALLVVILVLVITIPGQIWTRESDEMEKSRTNMITLYEAHSYFSQLQGRYTTKQDELINSIKNDSTLSLRLEIVKHTTRLKDALENFLNSPAVKNLYLISSNIRLIEEDFETNRRYFRSQAPEVLEKNISGQASELQLQLSTFRSGVEYENYRMAINAIDSLWQLRRDMTDYSLQSAARRAGILAGVSMNYLPNIDIRAINSTWRPLSVQITDFLSDVNSITLLKMKTTIADRVSDFQDNVVTGLNAIISMNRQSANNESQSFREEIDRVYQEFLSDFLVTEQFAQHRLSETDSLLLAINSDNFITPADKKPYIVNFTDTAGVSIEDPTLLSELRSQTKSVVEAVDNLPFMTYLADYQEKLVSLKTYYMEVKSASRRNLEITIKTKELDEVISKLSDTPVLSAHSNLQSFVDVVPNSDSYADIRSQIESALINSGIFRQIYEDQLFGNFDTLHVQLIGHLNEFNQIVSQVRRNTFSFDSYITEFNALRSQAESTSSATLLPAINSIEEDLTDLFLFASEGLEKNVYGLFSTKIENHGKVFGKIGLKSWEELD
jgi:hypothetical protein